MAAKKRPARADEIELRDALARLAEAVWDQAANRGYPSLTSLLKERAKRADDLLQRG